MTQLRSTGADTQNAAIPDRQTAMDLFEQHRAEWLAEARSVAVRLGKSGAPITVNDVRKVVSPLPEGVDPRVYGAIFNTPEWEFLTYVKSSRRTSHGRPVAQFQMIRAAA